jgi:hypothetical protein
MPKDAERRGAQEATAPPSRSVQQERPPDADQGGRGPSVEPGPRGGNGADHSPADGVLRRTTRRRTILNRTSEGEPWFWMPQNMTKSALFKAAGGGALLALQCLLDKLLEDIQINGHIPMSAREFVDRGVPKDGVSRYLARLMVIGVVDRTQEGAGSRPPHYGLTWLETKNADGFVVLPSNRWATVVPGLFGLAAAKRWLDAQPGCGGE